MQCAMNPALHWSVKVNFMYFADQVTEQRARFNRLFILTERLKSEKMQRIYDESLCLLFFPLEIILCNKKSMEMSAA